jgi:hypothetical protein
MQWGISRTLADPMAVASDGARAMETGEQVGDVFQDAVFVTILR